jgi:hypothetical protein
MFGYFRFGVPALLNPQQTKLPGRTGRGMYDRLNLVGVVGFTPMSYIQQKHASLTVINMDYHYPKLAVRDGSRIRLTSLSGLAIDASIGGADGVFTEFFLDYDSAFVLRNEKESFAGFTDCLNLNGGIEYDALAARLGAFREFVMVARDPQTGNRIGGANFISFPLYTPGQIDPAVLALNLNYVFINFPSRGKGYFRRLVSDLPHLALSLLLTTNGDDVPSAWIRSDHSIFPDLRYFIFFEQNDPYRMSPQDYELDTKYTGLDQLTRIKIWGRLGARIIDFPYVQPPLTSDQGADDTLVYSVLGAQETALTPWLLRAHLERFFGISVLKGRDPFAEPTAAKQLSILDKMCANHELVPLLRVEGVRGPFVPTPHPHSPQSSIRDLLRTFQ